MAEIFLLESDDYNGDSHDCMTHAVFDSFEKMENFVIDNIENLSICKWLGCQKAVINPKNLKSSFIEDEELSNKLNFILEAYKENNR